MFNVQDLVQSGGILLISLIIFAESGMFVGFFFPGDTLLLSAGIFAAQGKLTLALLLPCIALAAILGDNLGYLIGKHRGRRLFENRHSIIFNHDHLQRAETFFDRYGSKAMLLAHFVPIVRTFAPAAAGMSKMDHKRFFVYDAIGDIAWAVGVTLIGFFFGSKIPNIDRYILFVIAAVISITLVPALYNLIKAIRARDQELEDK